MVLPRRSDPAGHGWRDVGMAGHAVMAHGAWDGHAIHVAIVQAVRGQFVDVLRRALKETRARLRGLHRIVT